MKNHLGISSVYGDSHVSQLESWSTTIVRDWWVGIMTAFAMTLPTGARAVLHVERIQVSHLAQGNEQVTNRRS